MYGCVRVETRFYLFYGTRSLREVLGRYAPVTAAAVLTLNTIDIHWTMSRSSDPEYVLLKYIEPPHHVVVTFFNNTIQEGKIIFIVFINN